MVENTIARSKQGVPFETIARAVASVDTPPLLAAMAEQYGDERFLEDAFRPERPVVGATTKSDGGLSSEAERRAREMIVAALVSGVPAQADRAIDVDEIVTFLTGEAHSAFGDRLDRELSGDVVGDQGALAGMSVAVIGGGVSGVCAAVKLTEAGADYTIFERNPALGGTWYLNSYPGCRLDTNTFVYSYSFAQRSDWTHRFSPRTEVLAYVQEVAAEHDVEERTVFGADVTQLEWDDESSSWNVTWKDQTGESRTRRFDAVVSAVGQLNRPKIPDFAGASEFSGEIVHSATWRQEIDLAEKRVAVVGTGASGFQIVPSIVEEVSSLVLFQRNAPWLLPEPAYESPIPEAERLLFEILPSFGKWYRFWSFWAATEGRLPLTVVDPEWTQAHSVSAVNEAFREELMEHLQSEFGDRPDLLRKMTPHYPPSAKRLVRDSGRWAAALHRDHVTVEASPIERLTTRGIRTEGGEEYEVDVLVLATGFHADEYLAGIEVTGVAGLDLRDYWSGRPRAYQGVTVPGFPNFFMLYGPNTNLVVNGSLIFIIECAMDYAVAALRRARELGHRAIDTRPDALAAFVADMDRGNAARAWGLDSVDNWYKSISGAVTQTWPYGLGDYWERTRAVSDTAHRFSG